MALFFGEWEFPSQENKIETFKDFADYFNNGAKGENFEGFKILLRGHDLNNRTGVFIAEADDKTKII